MTFDQSVLTSQVSHDFDPVDGVPHILTAGATPGLDCFSKCFRLLDLRPNLRAVIGTVQVWCGDKLQATEPWYWQKPWPFHCWCIDPETGQVFDPSMHENLHIWAEVSEVSLSRRWDNGIVACTLPLMEDPLPLALFAPVFSDWPLYETPSCGGLVYVPGVIWNDPTATTGRLDAKKLMAWSKAARTTAVYGGVAYNQLESLLEQVEQYLAKPMGFAN